MNENEQLIHDFIHKVGVFDDLDGTPFVEPQDLQKLHYHKDTAKILLERAKSETSEQERSRLLKLIDDHICRMDRIFEKYEEGSWFLS
jgi:hypothetical protein